MPTIAVQLAGTYRTADLDRLLCDLAALDALTEPATVTVDLQDLGHISAPCVACAVASLLHLVDRGVVAPGSRIIQPRNGATMERLEELGVRGLLTNEPSASSALGSTKLGSRACHLFSTEDDPGSVAQTLTAAVGEVCEMDAPTWRAIWFALNEIAQNVFDHAEATSGIAIAEVGHGSSELEVAIADRGIGIRTSLAKNPENKIDSDLGALLMASSAGRSGRSGSPGSAGLGLYLTELLLRENGGGLLLRSGTAQTVRGASPSESSDLEYMTGTLVTLRFQTDQPVSLDTLLEGP